MDDYKLYYESKRSDEELALAAKLLKTIASETAEEDLTIEDMTAELMHKAENFIYNATKLAGLLNA